MAADMEEAVTSAEADMEEAATSADGATTATAVSTEATSDSLTTIHTGATRITILTPIPIALTRMLLPSLRRMSNRNSLPTGISVKIRKVITRTLRAVRAGG